VNEGRFGMRYNRTGSLGAFENQNSVHLKDAIDYFKGGTDRALRALHRDKRTLSSLEASGTALPSHRLIFSAGPAGCITLAPSRTTATGASCSLGAIR
jgi:hypothetical protein